MKIYDLNPGDLILLKSYDYSFLEEIKDIPVPIKTIKLNDSFPGAIISYTTKNGRNVNHIVFPEDIILVEHKDYNDKRWGWIANLDHIGDSWSLYKAPIAHNDRYKYMWQRWKSDNYYHCPYCDKALNSQDDIEDNCKEPIQECNCDGWMAREKEYNEFLDLQKTYNAKKAALLKDTKTSNLILDLRKRTTNDT